LLKPKLETKNALDIRSGVMCSIPSVKTGTPDFREFQTTELRPLPSSRSQIEKIRRRRLKSTGSKATQKNG
jgi:hypothetical protein